MLSSSSLGSMSRRRLLLSGAGAAFVGTSSLTLPGSSAQAQPNTFSLEGLHEQIVRRVAVLAAQREVELSILQPKGSLGNIKPLGDRFTEVTGVRIRYVEVPVDDINTQMMIDTLSDTGSFDLALPATFGLPDLIEAGALLNLDDLAARYAPAAFQQDALFSIGDYYKNSLYGYQTDGDTYLMFYNREWLEDETEGKRFEDEQGYPLKVPRTWHELDSMMAFFHRPEEKRYGGALFRTPNYIAWEWWIRFHAKGFWPFAPDMEPQINNEAGVAALEELIAASRHLYPEARTNGLFDNWKAFASGRIFCNIGWGGTQKFLNGPESAVRGKLAFSPTPGGIVEGELLQTPYFNWGWNYTVSSATKEPEIAYLFALFACSPVMSTLAVQDSGGYFDPFREEHYQDPKIVEVYSADFLKAHQASMRKSIPDLYLQGQGEYFDALRENIIRADRGEVSSQEALDTAAKQWRKTTRRMGRQSQAVQWQFLRSLYPEAIRERLA